VSNKAKEGEGKMERFVLHGGNGKVCVCEREREQYFCVFVCVCVRERKERVSKIFVFVMPAFHGACASS